MTEPSVPPQPVPEGDAACEPTPRQVIEALLFSADRPVPARQLAEIAGLEDARQARAILKELKEDYDRRGCAFALEEIAGGFQLLTRPQFAPYIRKLDNRRASETLSQAALETLAIVAYRQPISRAEIEDIRGVGCGHILRSLIERRLIKVVGRSEELGRPLLYGTTRHFLEAFGLRSLKDLPRRSEFENKFRSATQGEPGPQADEETA